MARTDVVSLPLSICIFKALMFLKHPSVGANSDMCYGGKSLQLQPCWTTYISGFGLTGLVKVQLFFCFCTVEDTEAVMSGTNCAGK